MLSFVLQYEYMIYYFLFPIVVIIASIIGAIAGIGGGVIIRPVLDAFGYFSTPEITNMISTMCVVFGTSTSIIRHVASKSKIENRKTAVYLGIGAVIGGVIGQFLFQFVKDSSNGDVLIIIQSSILIALLIFVLIYMQLMLPKGKQMHINNFIVTIIIGIFLGVCSTFLGIGGGPINVAVLLLFFGMSMKQAAINSLITIIFSQMAKIVMAGIDGTFVTLFTIDQLPTAADQSWWIFLIILVPISIIGSLLGTWFNKKMNNKGVQIVYMATTVAIILINIYLIVMSSIALA